MSLCQYLGGFLLAQKPVSGSNLFPVPAPSEAGFSAPAPKLPHTWKQTEKRISASALPLLSNEFDISSNSLSGAVHGCIAPDRGYPPLPVPLLSSVPPCTLLNVEFAPQTRCSDRRSVVHRRIEFAVQTRSSRMYRTYILERCHPWRFWMRTSVYIFDYEGRTKPKHRCCVELATSMLLLNWHILVNAWTWVCVLQTHCCLIRPPSVAVLNKTRSNQMYMDVYLVAMASLAVLN